MGAQSNDIAGLVDCIIRPLVEYPDDIQITLQEDEQDTVYIDICVNEEDAGKIIGRQGRVIKSIRTLARAAASRQGKQAEVEIVD